MVGESQMSTFTFSPNLRRWIDAQAESWNGANTRNLMPNSSSCLSYETLGRSTFAKPDDSFETTEQVLSEDRLRAERLAWVRPLERPMTWTNMGPKLRLAKQLVLRVRPPTLDTSAIGKVAAKLNAGLAGTPSSSLGSAATMRNVREAVFGAMHTAFEPIPDEALRTVTVINRRWTFTPETLDGITAKKLKNRFRTDLNRAGILRMPGPFIAFLHGEFEPASGLYVLHFHILTTVEKAEALRRLKRFNGYVPTASDAVPIFSRTVKDRRRQFSYLLKSYWPARTIRWINGAQKRDRGHHRIPEPFGSQVLLWLDRQRLRDLTIMNNCWSMRNGGTQAMKRLYLSVFGAW